MSMNILKLKKPTGFTLLEVMISMVIFSVGMLGLAGIQALALKNNNTAYQRTIAMQHSANMADLIRSSNSFDETVDSSFAGITTPVGSDPTKDCIADDTATLCSTTELAVFDIFHWKQRLASALPSGRGTVVLASSVYTITIMWDEKRTGVTGENCSGGASDLKCYVIQIQV